MSDPINTAAEKFLIILSESESLIDDAAAATYKGDYWSDLATGDAPRMTACLRHNELTYTKIARVLAKKLLQSAEDAEERSQALDI